MIIVPKVYSTVPTCVLHVVDNDTLQEIPRVFLRVAPYLYTKNKVSLKNFVILIFILLSLFFCYTQAHTYTDTLRVCDTIQTEDLILKETDSICDDKLIRLKLL